MRKTKNILMVICLFICFALVVSCDGLISNTPDSGSVNPGGDSGTTPLLPEGSSRDNPKIGTGAECDSVVEIIDMFYEIEDDPEYSQYLKETTTCDPENGIESRETRIGQCTVVAKDGSEHAFSGEYIQKFDSNKDLITMVWKIKIDEKEYWVCEEGTSEKPNDYVEAKIDGVWFRFEGGISTNFPKDVTENELNTISEIIGYANSILAEEYANLKIEFESDRITQFISETEILDSNEVKHIISGTISTKTDSEEGKVEETYDLIVDRVKYFASFRGHLSGDKAVCDSCHRIAIGDTWYSGQIWRSESDAWWKAGFSHNFPQSPSSEIVSELYLVAELYDLFFGGGYEEYISSSEDGSKIEVSECRVTYNDVTYTVSCESVSRSYVGADRVVNSINMTIDGKRYCTMAKGNRDHQIGGVYFYTDNCWFYYLGD